MESVGILRLAAVPPPLPPSGPKIAGTLVGPLVHYVGASASYHT